MSRRLIIDGNSVYEIDEDCEKEAHGSLVYGREPAKAKAPDGPGKSEKEIIKEGRDDVPPEDRKRESLAAEAAATAPSAAAAAEQKNDPDTAVKAGTAPASVIAAIMSPAAAATAAAKNQDEPDNVASAASAVRCLASASTVCSS
mgnify:CR=1 FL=1